GVTHSSVSGVSHDALRRSPTRASRCQSNERILHRVSLLNNKNYANGI
ncbi:hypothetical protein T265_10418, partial [Opisthorchis viverrini]